MRKILCVLLSAVLAVSALSGCAVQKNPDADDGKLHVVTTIFAPYDFARQVGGDDVSVTMLLRPGCEVHAYEPTPKDIIAIRNADVFIYVGGESDAWVKTVLDGVDNPNLRVVTLMDCVELLHEQTVEGMQAERHGHDHDEEDEDEDEEELDEHVWTARTRRSMRSAVGTMWSSLTALTRNFRTWWRMLRGKRWFLQTVSHCGILPTPTDWTTMRPIQAARTRPSRRLPRWHF